jgi:hypothetical protein
MVKGPRFKRAVLGFVAVCSLVLFIPNEGADAASEIVLSKGQTVYVPAYSHVLMGDRPLEFNMATTLNVRNTDTKQFIVIRKVNYYDSNGKLVKALLSEPKRLGPLASTSFFVKETDTSGGLNPSFIIVWDAEKRVNSPFIESVMIGGRGGQGISFVSQGQEIRESPE